GDRGGEADLESSVDRELVAQRNPFEELHHEVRRLGAGRAEVEDLDETRMSELRARRDLALEAGERRRVSAKVRVEELHRDVALITVVDRLVHRPHPALAEQREESISVRETRAEHAEMTSIDDIAGPFDTLAAGMRLWT